MESHELTEKLQALGVHNALYVPNFKRLDILREKEFVDAYFAPYRFCIFSRVMEEKGVTADIACMHSGPLGGDAEIAAMVVRKEIDLAVFLIDDLNPQPHEADIQMLLRQCRVHNVPIACNRYSADLMITSTLWDDDTYFPTEPKYVHFNRE